MNGKHPQKYSMTMITLTRITHPKKLQEYYCFRYRIYSESRLRVLADEVDGTDKDVYDDRAWHFGWYVGGKLVGCIRFIEPDDSGTPIPMLTYMTEPEAAAAVRDCIMERKAKGQRLIEASRFCLDPEQRSLRTAREFVMAMVMTMQPLGFEHGLFDCHETHSAFYRLLGFDMVGQQAAYAVPAFAQRWTIFRYDFRQLVLRNQQVMKGAGSGHRPDLNQAA